MPELPEVETVRRDLADLLAGAQVVSATVHGARSIRRGGGAPAFEAALSDRRLATFGRWGKFLLIGLRPGTDVLVVHLRMSGQILVTPASAAVPKHTHVVLSLADGRELRFVDPRTFGEMFVSSAELPELAGLGVDALDLQLGALRALLAARRARLKPLLLDQRVIAGIGNIYSDEILWRAKLRWSRPANQLRPVEVARLHAAIGDVLAEAIDRRGSSLRDAQYVDVSGRAGSFQEVHAVYDRLGLACTRCGRPIERTRVVQRSHYWCRRCQK
ncbi:MAG: bifunctional DNA-formamidopyrimidine glycosylase/DNA-(apurinic or apyrimidinic site) lyase [Acidimicrobiales bacterium]